jgi:hypothetical protein
MKGIKGIGIENTEMLKDEGSSQRSEVRGQRSEVRGHVRMKNVK